MTDYPGVLADSRVSTPGTRPVLALNVFLRHGKAPEELDREISTSLRADGISGPGKRLHSTHLSGFSELRSLPRETIGTIRIVSVWEPEEDLIDMENEMDFPFSIAVII